MRATTESDQVEKWAKESDLIVVPPRGPIMPFIVIISPAIVVPDIFIPPLFSERTNAGDEHC